MKQSGILVLFALSAITEGNMLIAVAQRFYTPILMSFGAAFAALNVNDLNLLANKIKESVTEKDSVVDYDDYYKDYFDKHLKYVEKKKEKKSKNGLRVDSWTTAKEK